MKILIAYASKTGTAAECAGMLRDELRGAEVTVADLTVARPDPDGFDVVIVGGSVRYGKLPKPLRAYLLERQTELEASVHGLFLCCGSGHDFEDYRDRLFPQSVTASAFAVLNFGGRLRLKNAGLFERILLHSARSRILENEMEIGEYTPTLPDILPENISRMASLLRDAYGRKNCQNP